MSNVSDTGDKMVMKDHDILIAVHTLQTEMMRRFDDYAKTNDTRHESHVRDIHSISLNQVQLNGDVTSIKGMISGLDERLDNVEKKSVRMDIAAYIGAMIAALVAWFK